mgnify:CR=1 FL=1
MTPLASPPLAPWDDLGSRHPMSASETIVAAATPAGRSALAVVRVDGPLAATIALVVADTVQFRRRTQDAGGGNR